MRIMLAVRHEGTPKLVGKVFDIDVGGGHPWRIFLHRETHASQAHRNLNSPGGVDLCVLDCLNDMDVAEVHHQRPSHHDTLVAPLAYFDEHAVPQRSGGRTRRFLAYPFWESYPDGHPAVAYRDPWISDPPLVLDPGPDLPPPRTRVQPGTGIVFRPVDLPPYTLPLPDPEPPA